MTGGGPGALLWKRIREKDGVSYGVGSGLNVSSFDRHTAWFAYAIYAPENRARVEQGFREEMSAARAGGFTAAQLADAKKGLLNSRRLARAQDGALANLLASELELDRTMAYDGRIDQAIVGCTNDWMNS